MENLITLFNDAQGLSLSQGYATCLTDEVLSYVSHSYFLAVT